VNAQGVMAVMVDGMIIVGGKTKFKISKLVLNPALKVNHRHKFHNLVY
jgi:hypothetical protein